MRRRIAAVGDALSAGGEILPYTQTTGLHARGHMLALIGGQARCNACNTIGIIAKAGGPRRMFYLSVREVALDGDIVRCGCASPQTIVALLTRETWFEDMAEKYLAVAALEGTGGDGVACHGPECFDEQFELRDARGNALGNTYYTLHYAGGYHVHGVTDDAGRTTRHRTHGEQPLHVYIGHRGELCAFG